MVRFTFRRCACFHAVAEQGGIAQAARVLNISQPPVAQAIDKLEAVTFALYKPRGYVTTARDEYGRRNVLDAMPDVPGLHPVGRLDRDSEGLLLLTTDGDLTQTLTHPSFGHEKAYRAWTGGDADPTAGELQALLDGVDLEDGPARALAAEPVRAGALVTLGEGRNREVRRMLDAIGHPVRFTASLSPARVASAV